MKSVAAALSLAFLAVGCSTRVQRPLGSLEVEVCSAVPGISAKQVEFIDLGNYASVKALSPVPTTRAGAVIVGTSSPYEGEDLLVVIDRFVWPIDAHDVREHWSAWKGAERYAEAAYHVRNDSRDYSFGLLTAQGQKLPTMEVTESTEKGLRLRFRRKGPGAAGADQDAPSSPACPG